MINSAEIALLNADLSPSEFFEMMSKPRPESDSAGIFITTEARPLIEDHVKSWGIEQSLVRFSPEENSFKGEVCVGSFSTTLSELGFTPANPASAIAKWYLDGFIKAGESLLLFPSKQRGAVLNLVHETGGCRWVRACIAGSYHPSRTWLFQA